MGQVSRHGANWSGTIVIRYFCASPPSLAASICTWVRFVGTLSHPTATQINSMRCQTSMLTHRGSTFISSTEGGKPMDALGLENPPIPPPQIPCRPDSPRCAVIKGEPAPLLLASFVYLQLELCPALLGPCTDVLCYVSFQTEYLCVWSAALFG